MMNFISKLPKFLTIILPFFILVACVDDDDNGNVIEGTNSIVNYMDKNAQFSLFAEAIERVGLSGTLDGNSGTYTIFAPNNEAVEAYLQTHAYENIAAVPQETLNELVRNHLLETIQRTSNFTTGYLKTMAQIPVNDSVDVNMSLFVDTENNSISFNGNTTIVSANIETDNGILHEVNHVIERPTLKTFLQIDSNLTPFYQALMDENLSTDFEEKLTSTQNFTTLLAPNSNAFDNFQEDVPTDYTILDNIYRNQFLDGINISTNFTSGYRKTQATDQFTGENNPISLYVNTEVGLLLNGNSNIIIPDIAALNGIIHVTDAVITLPTLKTFIAADNNLNTFEAALTRDDQAPENYLAILAETDTNASNAPFTVFAPTNQAFENVLLELYPEQNALLADIPTQTLTNILNLHLIPESNLKAENFESGTLNSLGGNIELDATENLLIDANQRTSSINLIEAQASNGTLFTIETVLLPLQ